MSIQMIPFDFLEWFLMIEQLIMLIKLYMIFYGVTKYIGNMCIG